MKTVKTFLGITVALAIMSSSCKKGERAPGVLYQLQASNRSSAINARTLTADLTWVSGFALVREIEFKGKKTGSEVKFEAESRQKLDLFAPISSLSTIVIPPGSYDNAEFEIKAAPGATEGSFELRGEYSKGGIVTPILFKIEVPVDIETKKSNFTVLDGASYTAVTTLNLSLLTSGIPESSFDNAARINNTIVISATSNPGLFNTLYDRLRNCGGIEIK
jgi:hypothetical protein